MRVKEIRKNPLFLCPDFRLRGRCGVLRRGMCGLSLKNISLRKLFYDESTADKRKPPSRGKHFYSPFRGRTDLGVGGRAGRDRPYRDQGRAGMYRLRKTRRAGALRLFGRALYDGAGETRRCRRNRRRFAGLLCRSQRVALRPARPCVPAGNISPTSPAQRSPYAAGAGRARRSTG